MSNVPAATFIGGQLNGTMPSSYSELANWNGKLFKKEKKTSKPQLISVPSSSSQPTSGRQLETQHAASTSNHPHPNFTKQRRPANEDMDDISISNYMKEHFRHIEGHKTTQTLPSFEYCMNQASTNTDSISTSDLLTTRVGVSRTSPITVENQVAKSKTSLRARRSTPAARDLFNEDHNVAIVNGRRGLLSNETPPIPSTSSLRALRRNLCPTSPPLIPHPDPTIPLAPTRASTSYSQFRTKENPLGQPQKLAYISVPPLSPDLKKEDAIGLKSVPLGANAWRRQTSMHARENGEPSSKLIHTPVPGSTRVAIPRLGSTKGKGKAKYRDLSSSNVVTPASLSRVESGNSFSTSKTNRQYIPRPRLKERPQLDHEATPSVTTSSTTMLSLNHNTSKNAAEHSLLEDAALRDGLAGETDVSTASHPLLSCGAALSPLVSQLTVTLSQPTLTQDLGQSQKQLQTPTRSGIVLDNLNTATESFLPRSLPLSSTSPRLPTPLPVPSPSPSPSPSVDEDPFPNAEHPGEGNKDQSQIVSSFEMSPIHPGQAPTRLSPETEDPVRLVELIEPMSQCSTSFPSSASTPPSPLRRSLANFPQLASQHGLPAPSSSFDDYHSLLNILSQDPPIQGPLSLGIGLSSVTTLSPSASQRLEVASSEDWEEWAGRDVMSVFEQMPAEIRVDTYLVSDDELEAERSEVDDSDDEAMTRQDGSKGYGTIKEEAVVKEQLLAVRLFHLASCVGMKIAPALVPSLVPQKRKTSNLTRSPSTKEKRKGLVEEGWDEDDNRVKKKQKCEKVIQEEFGGEAGVMERENGALRTETQIGNTLRSPPRTRGQPHAQDLPQPQQYSLQDLLTAYQSTLNLNAGFSTQNQHQTQEHGIHVLDQEAYLLPQGFGHALDNISLGVGIDVGGAMRGMDAFLSGDTGVGMIHGSEEWDPAGASHSPESVEPRDLLSALTVSNVGQDRLWNSGATIDPCLLAGPESISGSRPHSRSVSSGHRSVSSLSSYSDSDSEPSTPLASQVKARKPESNSKLKGTGYNRSRLKIKIKIPAGLSGKGKERAKDVGFRAQELEAARRGVGESASRSETVDSDKRRRKLSAKAREAKGLDLDDNVEGKEKSKLEDSDGSMGRGDAVTTHSSDDSDDESASDSAHEPNTVKSMKREKPHQSQSQKVSSKQTAREANFYCHQCRNANWFDKMRCTVIKDAIPCGLRYCEKCITIRYKDVIEFDSFACEFICPKCQDICNCTACCMKRGEEYVSTRHVKFEPSSRAYCVPNPRKSRDEASQQGGINERQGRHRQRDRRVKSRDTAPEKERFKDKPIPPQSTISLPAGAVFGTIYGISGQELGTGVVANGDQIVFRSSSSSAFPSSLLTGGSQYRENSDTNSIADDTTFSSNADSSILPPPSLYPYPYTSSVFDPDATSSTFTSLLPPPFPPPDSLPAISQPTDTQLQTIPANTTKKRGRYVGAIPRGWKPVGQEPSPVLGRAFIGKKRPVRVHVPDSPERDPELEPTHGLGRLLWGDEELERGYLPHDASVGIMSAPIIHFPNIHDTLPGFPMHNGQGLGEGMHINNYTDLDMGMGHLNYASDFYEAQYPEAQTYGTYNEAEEGLENMVQSPTKALSNVPEDEVAFAIARALAMLETT